MIFPRIVIFSLSCILCSSCLSEYFFHWESRHGAPKIASEMSASGKLEGTLSVLPDTKKLTQLVDSINHAKKRVWIETYIWTEKSTQEAVIRAAKRGVDVRVILEGNVYQTPKINEPIAKQLREKDIKFTYASDAFSFTHMKMWLIDEAWCVSTGNFTYTSFSKNREFIFCSKDVGVLDSLEELFLADFSHIRPLFHTGGLDARIGLAPMNMRDFLERSIARAKNEIIIYNQTVTDSAILGILSEKTQSNVRVFICHAATSEKKEGNFSGISFLTSTKPYLHAKVFIIDNTTILLGSANMTQNAIDNNREIMIRIDNNPALLSQIKSLYNTDCKNQD